MKYNSKKIIMKFINKFKVKNWKKIKKKKKIQDNRSNKDIHLLDKQ